jgi:hypothetical protein
LQGIGFEWKRTKERSTLRNRSWQKRKADGDVVKAKRGLRELGEEH